ncbi:UGMP family protein, partial [Ramicandelaber brevisporus]
RLFTVLGFETSCDDTSIALVRSDGLIIAQSHADQNSIHEQFGGIHPTQALNSHTARLPGVLMSVFDQARIVSGKRDALTHELFDAVAVTRGPGLPASLNVGLNAAKAVAAVTSKPLLGIHHMEAHALMARMPAYAHSPTINSNANDSSSLVQFPFLTLLISGGHTMTVLAKQLGDYSIIGETLDDSVGEAFDKVARTLSIPWKPGRGGGPGAALEELALTSSNTSRYTLPMPLSQGAHKSQPIFSFSGLKTAVKTIVDKSLASSPSRNVQPFDISSKDDVADMAAAFQATASAHLAAKTDLALRKAGELLDGEKVRCLVVSGGVASNKTVRSHLEAVAQQKYGIPLVAPPPRLCTDNGVMIAWTGIERFKQGFTSPLTITQIPKWPLSDI